MILIHGLGRAVIGRVIWPVFVLGATLAWSQQPGSPVASPPTPRVAPAASIEPGVDTSAPRTPMTMPAVAPRLAPVSDPATTTSAARDSSAGTTPALAARRGGRAMDRVNLDASQITGNRELPRVLYIVPWRAPAAGDIEGRPVNSLLYELTKPVDREVFRRENRYFDALQVTAGAAAGASAPGAAPPATGGPEK